MKIENRDEEINKSLLTLFLLILDITDRTRYGLLNQLLVVSSKAPRICWSTGYKL